MNLWILTNDERMNEEGMVLYANVFLGVSLLPPNFVGTSFFVFWLQMREKFVEVL